MGQFVDLHIHSSFSDGSASVEFIVNDAARKNIKYLSITDHNGTDANRFAQEKCDKQGIFYIPGAELDALLDNVNIHVLAYGKGCLSPRFEKVAQEIANIQEEKNRYLIRQMEEDYSVSLTEYEKFSYDISLGGWKALHYFVHKGLAESIKEGMKFYGKYDCSSVRFPEAEDVFKTIHDCGCIAVLAHPVNYWADSSGRLIINNELIESLADGIECFYAYNDSEHTVESLTLCRKLNKQITAGADYHGTFGNTEIGDTNTRFENVRIDKIIEAIQ